MSNRFPLLFQPLSLRSITLRNRTVVCPMGCRYARDGKPTAADMAFYRARAEGGAGLVIMGGTSVHQTTLLKSRVALEAFDPKAIPAFAELANAIHEGGAKVIGQINHRGREMLDADSGRNRDVDYPTWAPSAIPTPNDPLVPHEMNQAEIDEIVSAYAVSARNLMAAGFDGIEIHGAHGYLVAQFLSPQANQRSDNYGGPLPNRARFLLELIRAIRFEIGPASPLGVRISADEDIEDGLTIKDSTALSKLLAATSEVDYISVTRGIRNYYVKDMSFPLGVSVDLARAIRDASGLPTMVAGRITHPTYAEQVLEQQAADLIGMARAWIVDAEWANKAASGSLDSIRPCIGCLQDCRTGGMACVHNPTAGRELMWGVGPGRANQTKRVVVIGGGPAGLEAATVAAQRGHQVILFEREAELGGQIRLASRAPHRTEVDGVISYRVGLLEKLTIDVRLRTEATPESILAEKPDAVIVATGALPGPLEIQGADERLISNWALLENAPATSGLVARARTGVVVDDGSGFWETFSAVECLAERGVSVTLVSPARVLGIGIPHESIEPLFRRLRSRGVKFMPSTAVAWMEPDNVVIYDHLRYDADHTFVECRLQADLVVVNPGRRSDDRLLKLLGAGRTEVIPVGDCIAPRRISQAVLEAHRAVRSL